MESEFLAGETAESVIPEFQAKYRWLSNFWGCDILSADGRRFATVEHAFQWTKFLGVAGAEKVRDSIANASSPANAKRIASQFKYLARPDWLDIRIEVMRRLLRQKFARGSELAAKLLATGDAELVEGNRWRDFFWGVCDGRGENWLGKLLMEIRSELRLS